MHCKLLSITCLKETKGELADRLPNRAWSDFIESLDLFVEGAHGPESALAGTPLALDDESVMWKAIALFGKADGEQLVAWGMPSYNDPDELCGCCLASRSTRPYTHLRENASWQVTEISTTAVLVARLTRPHHPFG